jgi:Flp pilus assembly protein TadG
MSRKLKIFAAITRAFISSSRGNVAMIFAISVIPLMIGAGTGLDFARAMLVRQQMGEALDAAALAVGSTPGLDATKAQDLAQKYFDANYTVNKSQYGSVTILPPVYDAKGSISLTAKNDMPTILMKLAGITSVPIATTSTVVWGQTKLWAALVLDNSGSMCQPDAQPCLDDPNKQSKIYQLKDATKTMLNSLQAISATPGDVRVAIVPFNREVDVGISMVGASWIYWGFWEAEPPNANLNNVTDLNGPNDNCPFNLGTQGYGCLGAGGIPSSGLICPGSDNGSVNHNRKSRYYNGCYTSEPTGATQQVFNGNGAATCSNHRNCSCTPASNGNPKHCDANLYRHVWTPNPHSSWGGCITDREQDYDISNAAPSGSDTTGFPADNPANPVSATDCMDGNVTPLEYDWADLATKAGKMQAAGSTNQAIGVAHGWEILTPGGAYGTPALPDNTTRYIILLSDGLNTQNRWWGDGHTEGTPEDEQIDTRMNKVCSAAKADGVIIYAVYVHTAAGSSTSSTPLQNCATDTSKYYNLTSSSQIAAAFADITKKITNVRVSM